MLTQEIIEHSYLLVQSFQSATKGKLLPDRINKTAALAENLYNAPFVLLSHGTQADPVFNYANLAAQKLWEMDWGSFTQLPSRLSAEPIAVAARQAMLEEARQKGYISNYEGVRISRSGRRFVIKNAVLWNVHDATGKYQGQAATFHEWIYL